MESTITEAISAAREIVDPYDRAWALRELAGAPLADSVEAKELLGEAKAAAEEIEGVEPQAFALSDIAAALAALASDEAMEWVESIAANAQQGRANGASYNQYICIDISDTGVGMDLEVNF